jgi:hypothetical protein
MESLLWHAHFRKDAGTSGAFFGWQKYGWQNMRTLISYFAIHIFAILLANVSAVLRLSFLFFC